MRIGNFWGITAPMAIIAFDERREELLSRIIDLNSGSTAQLLPDMQKEFAALRKAVKKGGWEIPEYTIISENFPRELKVRGMKIVGRGEVDNSVFLQEVCFKVIERLLKLEAKGEYKELPTDLRGSIKERFPEEFTMGDLRRNVRKFVNDLKDCDSSQLFSIAQTFFLKPVTPDIVWNGTTKTVMTADLTKVWQYFHDRLDFIEQCITACSCKQTEEEMIFNLSFFDLIKRKPASIKYFVLEVFQRVKDKRYAYLLGSCRDECRAEIKKFREAYRLNVESDNETQEVDASVEEIEQYLMNSGQLCLEFFRELIEGGRLKLVDISKKEVEIVTGIFDAVKEMDSRGLADVFQVDQSAVSELCQRSCDIGIYGLNEYSIALLEDAAGNISLSERGKIKKTEAERKEISFHLQDVDALLDTLIPIGTPIGRGEA